MGQLNPHVRATFADHINAFLEKKFLTRLEKELHLMRFGMPKTLGKHNGVTVKWNRFSNLSASTTALSDGVSPDGTTATSAAVTATLSQYGQFLTTSDQLQDTAINDTMEDFMELLAYGASLTLDTLIRNELDANGTQVYTDRANNSSKANVETGTDRISSAELKQLVKDFRVADVPPYEDGQYVGVIHPLAEYDLLAETAASSFIILASNTDKTHIEKAAIGKAFGFNLYRSSNIRADATSTNTYGNIFCGRNGFGNVALTSLKPEVIVMPLGSAGSQDPLKQRATVGYKLWFAAKVLEAARVRTLWAYSA